MKLRYIIFIFGLFMALLWSYTRITKNNNRVKNDTNYETIDADMNNIDAIPTHGSVVEEEQMDTEKEETNELGQKVIYDTQDIYDIQNIYDTQHEVKDSLLIDNKDNYKLGNDDIDEKIISNTAKQEKHLPEDNLSILDTSSYSNNIWRVIDRKDNYNNELQYYIKENVLLLDNKIVITSKREEKEDKNYTSGLVESNYGYLYGYFEFTIRLNYGKGIFPAIWFMPVKDLSYPEIDVFEMVGSEPEIFYGVIHYLDSNNKKSRDYFTKKVKVKDSYKIALEWSKEELIWYIDDKVVHRTNKGVPNQYMYLIINQAIGGNWPGEPNKETNFPAKFVIENITINPNNKMLRD